MNRLERMSDDIYEGLGRHLPEMSSGWADIAKQVEEFENAIRADQRKATLRETADAIRDTNPDRSREFSEGVDWVESELRRIAEEGSDAPAAPPA